MPRAPVARKLKADDFAKCRIRQADRLEASAESVMPGCSSCVSAGEVCRISPFNRRCLRCIRRNCKCNVRLDDKECKWSPGFLPPYLFLTDVVALLSSRFLDVQQRRRAKTRELLQLQSRIELLLKEVSVLQDEEAEFKERARFLSEREDDLLDAFESVESRGGGVERLDPGLEAVIPNSEMVLDEWLQFSGSDFFGTSEVPVGNS